MLLTSTLSHQFSLRSAEVSRWKMYESLSELNYLKLLSELSISKTGTTTRMELLLCCSYHHWRMAFF